MYSIFAEIINTKCHYAMEGSEWVRESEEKKTIRQSFATVDSLMAYLYQTAHHIGAKNETDNAGDIDSVNKREITVTFKHDTDYHENKRFYLDTYDTFTTYGAFAGITKTIYEMTQWIDEHLLELDFAPIC